MIFTLYYEICICYYLFNIDFNGSIFYITWKEGSSAVQHRKGPNKVGVLVYYNQ